MTEERGPFNVVKEELKRGMGSGLARPMSETGLESNPTLHELIVDDLMVNLLTASPEALRQYGPYSSLIPALNKMVRTSNISPAKAEELEWTLDLIIDLHKTSQPESATTTSNSAFYEALKFYGRIQIQDAINGKRLEKVLETRQKVTLEETTRTGGRSIMDRLRGR